MFCSAPALSESLVKVFLSARGHFHEKIIPPMCIGCSSAKRDYTARKHKIPLQVLSPLLVLQL